MKRTSAARTNMVNSSAQDRCTLVLSLTLTASRSNRSDKHGNCCTIHAQCTSSSSLTIFHIHPYQQVYYYPSKMQAKSFHAVNGNMHSPSSHLPQLSSILLSSPSQGCIPDVSGCYTLSECWMCMRKSCTLAITQTHIDGHGPTRSRHRENAMYQHAPIFYCNIIRLSSLLSSFL